MTSCAECSAVPTRQSAAPARARAGFRTSLGSLVVHAADVLLAWQDRARQRHRLAALDDHTLKDIGLTRADIEFELRKPVWRR